MTFIALVLQELTDSLAASGEAAAVSQAHGTKVGSAFDLGAWHAGKLEPQGGPQHTAPLDQQCLKGWRNTEEDLEVHAVWMRLGCLWGIGKGLSGLEMGFHLTPA